MPTHTEPSEFPPVPKLPCNGPGNPCRLPGDHAVRVSLDQYARLIAAYARVAELEGIVAKLPKTADEVTAVLGMTVWHYSKGGYLKRRHVHGISERGKLIFGRKNVWNVNGTYSTRAACEAAGRAKADAKRDATRAAASARPAEGSQS